MEITKIILEWILKTAEKRLGEIDVVAFFRKNWTKPRMASLYASILIPSLVIVPLVTFHGSWNPLSRYQGMLSVARIKSKLAVNTGVPVPEQGVVLIIDSQEDSRVSVPFRGTSLAELSSNLERNDLVNSINNDRLKIASTGLSLNPGQISSKPLVILAQGHAEDEVEIGSKRKLRLDAFPLVSKRSATLGMLGSGFLLLVFGVLIGDSDVLDLILGQEGGRKK